MTCSLRLRLVIGIVAAMVLLLTVFSLIVYIVIQRALLNQFDAALLSTVRMLAASIEADRDRVELELDVQQMPEFNNPQHPTHYQIWRHDGTVVAKSPLLGTRNLPRLGAALNTPAFRALTSETGEPERAVTLKFLPRGEPLDLDNPRPAAAQMLTLTVARDASTLFSQLRLLRWLLLVTSAVTIAFSVLVAVLVVRQGLNPLNRLAAEIAAIRENDLAVRIGTTSVPPEIAPIKERLNDLLSRLEDAFKREKRFTADVAHELRTPLAAIRSTIEVTLTRARRPDEYKTVLSDCHALVENMQAMVNNLLMLVRLDAKQISFRTEPIRLAELVNCCWKPFSDKALERKITFDNRIDPELICESDRHYLSILLSNVLENAVEYTNHGGQAWVTARQMENSLEIAVSNTGCRLTQDQAAQVFDSFWRADVSRSDAGLHCGLGLAIVQRITTALGGDSRVEVDPAGIFTIKLTLPSKPPQPNPS